MFLVVLDYKFCGSGKKEKKKKDWFLLLRSLKPNREGKRKLSLKNVAQQKYKMKKGMIAKLAVNEIV